MQYLPKRVRPCRGCRFLGGLDCDYLLITGKKRPCAPGEGCTVKESGHPKKRRIVLPPKHDSPKLTTHKGPGRKPTVFEALERSREAKDLYEAGASDGEIAERMGCHKNTVAKWRKQTGRASRYKFGGNRKNV